MRNLARISLVVLVGWGCSKEKPAPVESTPAPSAAPSAEPKAKKKPEAPGKEPPKKAEHETLATYWKAMNDGRAATRAKKWEDAYAAFDRALKAMPDDARAISERGYAKLLAKDYVGAIADLDRAVARTKDRKLLGQIYFNNGLAAEAKGDAAAARAAFARSNEYNPTPAAKKKLEGQTTCTAVITAEPPSSPPKTYATWRSAYDDARKEFEDLEEWSSEGATLGKFCSNKWSSGAACVATLGIGNFEGRLYVPTKAGKIAMFELALVGGRCGGSIEPKVVSDEGDVTHVSWKTSQGISVLLTEKNGEMVDCGEKDLDCTSACGDDEITYNDLFVAKDSGESMLFVGREADKDKDPLTLSVEMPVVKIKGKGCDTERPLAR